MVVVDFHIHVYPCYDIGKLLRYAYANLSRVVAVTGVGGISHQRVLCLTERSECQFFNEAVGCADSLYRYGDWSVSKTADDNALLLRTPAGEELWIINGRQISSAERLEVLALVADRQLGGAWKDGTPAKELIASINASGGIAVLNWAPGKWSGGRGEIIRGLIENASAGEVSLSETSLRASRIAPHKLIELGRQKGLRIFCGSDPLPFVGEERSAGIYAMTLEGSLDRDKPATWLRRAIKGGAALKPVSLSRPALPILYRLLRNEVSRRLGC